jgi:hypothetical protein
MPRLLHLTHEPVRTAIGSQINSWPCQASALRYSRTCFAPPPNDRSDLAALATKVASGGTNTPAEHGLKYPEDVSAFLARKIRLRGIRGTASGDHFALQGALLTQVTYIATLRESGAF